MTYDEELKSILSEMLHLIDDIEKRLFTVEAIINDYFEDFKRNDHANTIKKDR